MRILIAAAIVVGGPLLTAQERRFKPFDAVAFEQHATELGATQSQLEAFRRECADGIAAAAADSLLQALAPAYGRAAGRAQEGEPRAALELAELVASTDDPYLRAHGRYQLGRVFLDGDDPEAAAEIFAEFLRDDANVTPLDSEAMYFYGHSLAEVPEPARAAAALQDFLELFPGAPERYRASASQQLAELLGQEGSELHVIADTMKTVERRIRKTDTGEETQEKQKAVMEQLAKIIEELEEQENQSSGAPSGLNRPAAPAGKSAASAGQTRVGSLGRVNAVVDRWGAMQDRDREAIETDLQTKLPGHYRRMLEDYYKRLGTGGR